METLADNSKHAFLRGGGEMGERTRTFDWSQTTLGTPDQWPQSLRTIVSVIIQAGSPMFLWWGGDRIQFYNDAYRTSLGSGGRHPTAFGQPGTDCPPDTWLTVAPLIDRVLAGGDAVWRDDRPTPGRHGKPEAVYWTFSYSPVPDDCGRPAGVLAICSETAGAGPGCSELAQTRQQVLATFEQAPVAIAILTSPDLTFLMANAQYRRLAGRSAAQLINRPLLDAIPETRGQGYAEKLEQVIRTNTAYTALEAPFMLRREDSLDKLYFDFTCQPWQEAGHATG